MKVKCGLHEMTLGKQLAEGGEARIFRMSSDPNLLAKIYRLPTDPEYESDPFGKQGARIRLLLAQTKLPLFPKNLPATVVCPQDIVRDPITNIIIGFTMSFVQNAQTLSDFQSRTSSIDAGLDDHHIVKFFQQLANTVQTLHERGIIIGDFNDNNILIQAGEPLLIDSDSLQFGGYRTRAFMPTFVDPNLCDSKTGALELIHPHTYESDWYAFWVIFFRILCGIHPYGGVYRPKDPVKKISDAIRGLSQHRISVFHTDVVYPKQARSFDELPKSLLNIFRKVFEQGLRPVPTPSLFNNLSFLSDGSFDSTKSVQVQQVIAPKNLGRKCVEKEIFRTDGLIEDVEVSQEQLRYLYSDRERNVFREDRRFCGKTSPRVEGLTDNGYYLAGNHCFNIKTVGNEGQDRVIMLFNSNDQDGIEINNMRSLCLDIVLAAGGNYGVAVVDSQEQCYVYTGRKTPVKKELTLSTSKNYHPIQLFSFGNFLIAILGDKNDRLNFSVIRPDWEQIIYSNNIGYCSQNDVFLFDCKFDGEMLWLFTLHADEKADIKESWHCTIYDGKNILTELDTDDASAPFWLKHPESTCAIKGNLFYLFEGQVHKLSVQPDGSLEETIFGTHNTTQWNTQTTSAYSVVGTQNHKLVCCDDTRIFTVETTN